MVNGAVWGLSPSLHLPRVAGGLHTPGFDEEQGIIIGYLTPSGPRATQPGLQLWTNLWLDSAAHVTGQRRAAQLLPTLSLGVSTSYGPFPKPHISNKTKMVHQTKRWAL